MSNQAKNKSSAGASGIRFVGRILNDTLVFSLIVATTIGGYGFTIPNASAYSKDEVDDAKRAYNQANTDAQELQSDLSTKQAQLKALNRADDSEQDIAGCDLCRPTCTAGCDEKYLRTLPFGNDPVQMDAIRSGNSNSCLKIYEAVGGNLSEIPPSCGAYVAKCGVVVKTQKKKHLKEDIDDLTAQLKAKQDEVTKLRAAWNEKKDDCEDCQLAAQREQMKEYQAAMQPSTGQLIVGGIAAATPLLLGGLSTWAGLKSLNAYSNNYNNYLQSCTTVGIPCMAPSMMGGMGMMGGMYGAGAMMGLGMLGGLYGGGMAGLYGGMYGGSVLGGVIGGITGMGYPGMGMMGMAGMYPGMGMGMYGGSVLGGVLGGITGMGYPGMGMMGMAGMYPGMGIAGMYPGMGMGMYGGSVLGGVIGGITGMGYPGMGMMGMAGMYPGMGMAGMYPGFGMAGMYPGMGMGMYGGSVLGGVLGGITGMGYPGMGMMGMAGMYPGMGMGMYGGSALGGVIGGITGMGYPGMGYPGMGMMGMAGMYPGMGFSGGYGLNGTYYGNVGAGSPFTSGWGTPMSPWGAGFNSALFPYGNTQYSGLYNSSLNYYSQYAQRSQSDLMLAQQQAWEAQQRVNQLMSAGGGYGGGYGIGFMGNIGGGFGAGAGMGTSIGGSGGSF